MKLLFDALHAISLTGEPLFLALLNRSIAAGWIILALVALRPLLKKAPKAISCALFAIVALRLVCPTLPESPLSLIPSTETLPRQELSVEIPELHTGVPVLNETIGIRFSEAFRADAPTVPDASIPGANPLQSAVRIAAILWMIGVLVLLLHALVAYLRLGNRLREAVQTEKGIFVCDRIATPFLFGILRPRIFLPSSLKPEDTPYVIAHERAHLARLDHITKPLAYLILCAYWFNPLIWAAFALFCRDMEYACDERVLKALGEGEKTSYADALITCAAPRFALSACPIAFGEVGVKARIRSILSYKKPAAAVLVLGVILYIGLSACFLTDPEDEPITLPQPTDTASTESTSPETSPESTSAETDSGNAPPRSPSSIHVDFPNDAPIFYVDGNRRVTLRDEEQRNIRMILEGNPWYLLIEWDLMLSLPSATLEFGDEQLTYHKSSCMFSLPSGYFCALTPFEAAIVESILVGYVGDSFGEVTVPPAYASPNILYVHPLSLQNEEGADLQKYPLSGQEKQQLLAILNDKKEAWVEAVPLSIYRYRIVSSDLRLGYDGSGILDYQYQRYRYLSADEKECIESILSRVDK